MKGSWEDLQKSYSVSSLVVQKHSVKVSESNLKQKLFLIFYTLLQYVEISGIYCHAF